MKPLFRLWRVMQQGLSRLGGLRFWLPLGVALIFVVGVERIIDLEQEAVLTHQLDELNEQLFEVRQLVNSELNAAIYFTRVLKSYIQATGGELQPEAMTPWLTNLQAQGRHIRNIGLAPGNRISYVYPLEGNESALGLYYPDQPEQWPDVELVIRTREPKLIGPFELVQGGTGLVYREAIYLDDDRYWGIVSMVLNGDSLFGALETAKQSTAMALAIEDLDQGRLLWQSHGFSSTYSGEPLYLGLDIPGRHWRLSAQVPRAAIPYRLELLAYLAWFFSGFSALLVWRVLVNVAAKKRATSALLASQARFTQVFKASPLGMGLLDSQLHWLDVNSRLCSLLGVTEEALKGQPLQSLFSPLDWRELIRLKRELLQLEEPERHQQFEMTIHPPLGGSFKALISLGFYRRDGWSQQRLEPEHQQWIIQLIDITERVRIEQLKDDFVSTVSHELRTPLTVIVGGLKVLASGSLGAIQPRAQQLLEIALRNGEKLSHIINDLLDINKLIAGKMEFHFERQPLRPLLDQALELNQYLAEQYQVSFDACFNECEVSVNVDNLRMHQLLTNLISNAAKFSPRHAKVVIGCEPRVDWIRVYVQDQGPGISEQDQAKLFKKFSQIDSSSRRQVGGSGLGLAISKEIVERMDGKLGVDSAPGAGARFYVDLPIAH